MVRLYYYIIAFIIFSSSLAEQNKIYSVALNENNSISLHWLLDYNKKSVNFELHLPSANNGWFAFGFSDRGQLFPADYCFLSKDMNGKYSLKDTWSDENGVLHLDKQQDCRGFQIHQNGDVLKYSYSRLFDTCDRKDYIIEDGTTHVVWSKGSHPLYQINGLNISTRDRENFNMVRIHLLKNTKVNTTLSLNMRPLDILTEKVAVPAEETTYWCHVYKLPDAVIKKKHHIYQYEANIEVASQGLVHHMEIFHCETADSKEIPLYVGNCFAKERPQETQVCKRVLAAWAMGAPPFVYPQQAALPIGGPNFNPYIMLEVHYNNPGKRADFVDSSGIRFFISPKLKEMDAGVIELGLEYTDKMAIPPGQESFPLTGFCTSACTSMGLPVDGITIFGSQLHTHLTGIKVSTRHFDLHGNELPELNRDNHFSTHFQEIRLLKQPVKVFPGDMLITRCDYNTEDRVNVTLGGFGIKDEMCVNYIHYFPRAELEVCKSSISDQALVTYFQYMNEWEGQNTWPNKGVADNYQAIEWNKLRVQLLNEVYGEAPLSMQCNMSTGDRFPGYWENSRIPIVLEALPPPHRACSHHN